jgi:hypothetical protein
MTQEAVKVIREALEWYHRDDVACLVSPRYMKAKQALSALDSIAGGWRGIDKSPLPEPVCDLEFSQSNKLYLMQSKNGLFCFGNFLVHITDWEDESEFADPVWKEGHWYISEDCFEPVCWMPLPEPPKGEEE